MSKIGGGAGRDLLKLRVVSDHQFLKWGIKKLIIASD